MNDGKDTKNYFKPVIEREDYESGNSCRFCNNISKDTSEGNEEKMVQLCLCAKEKSVGHLSCLKEVYEKKMNQYALSNVFTTTFNRQFCGECKCELPLTVKLKEKVLEMIKIPRDSLKDGRPYIVFETISNLKHDYKSLYLIWASEKSHTITIGRKKDSNLRILHRSVSREHGEIEYFASCFHIRDFRSKYGTAVQVREPVSYTHLTLPTIYSV
eukprot:TRINITY_DN2712_c0_g1_i15.p1 TRINITY_DN2712_c0_g1~~TRINITY_DN2712_c0_g1_i15.p1  ORF type:complete len:214 (-),score=18.00 TRINITY_DN2712_c0_g1_i15:36-677(-)